MTIEQLFNQYLNSDTDGAINELETIIDSEDHTDSQSEYYNVNDNEVRGFFDNDNFYITGVNDHELNEPMQFDY